MFSQSPYVGRFAPSPSGDLHFGSLVCALASFLDARAHGGEWLVRMEDIDPPREQAGAKASILKCLESHGLHWDRHILYQSERGAAYLDALQTLYSMGLVYRCNCTRKRLSQLRRTGAMSYDRHCAHTAPPEAAPAAWRFNLNPAAQVLGHGSVDFQFHDAIAGSQQTMVRTQGDFVVHRKDGLFAYNLAVVVDDIAQNVSHIVRGADLLPSVGQQNLLASALVYRANGRALPQWHYSHIPLVVTPQGDKLSKQNRAQPIDPHCAASNLRRALAALNIPATEGPADIEDLLQWGIQQWRPQRLQGIRHLALPELATPASQP